MEPGGPKASPNNRQADAGGCDRAAFFEPACTRLARCLGGGVAVRPSRQHPTVLGDGRIRGFGGIAVMAVHPRDGDAGCPRPTVWGGQPHGLPTANGDIGYIAEEGNGGSALSFQHLPLPAKTVPSLAHLHRAIERVHYLLHRKSFIQRPICRSTDNYQIPCTSDMKCIKIRLQKCKDAWTGSSSKRSCVRWNNFQCLSRGVIHNISCLLINKGNVVAVRNM